MVIFLVSILLVAAWEILPIGLFLISIPDGLVIAYVVWNTSRMSFFVIYSLVMITMVKSMQLHTITNNLSAFLPTVVEQIYTETSQLKTKQRALSKIMYSYLCKRIVATFRAFMRKHSSIFIYAVNWNRRLIANLILVAFVTTVFANIHMIVLLVYRPLTLAERFIFLCMIILQAILSFVALESLITFGNVLHRAKNPIYSLQAVLHVNLMDGDKIYILREKIKIMRYTELLNSKNRFTFTVGKNISPISHSSIYEVTTKFDTE